MSSAESDSDEPAARAFHAAFRGRFTGVLTWRDLDELWQRLRANAGAGWFVYAVGEPVPHAPAAAEAFRRFIAEIDVLLRREHDEDYCGIVYVDDKAAPAFVKIFDPHRLGVQCGFSDNPPLPGWVLSRISARPLENGVPVPNSRRRWWRRLWA